MDNNTFHKIPVTFFDESYNKYQNEVMNLSRFIRAFHPVSIVNPERFNRFERQAEKVCCEMQDVKDLQHFQFALNSLLVLLEDAHTYFMPEDGLIYPFEIRYYEDCFYLYAIDPKYPDFTGKEIVSINDKSVKDIRAAMRKAMPSENEVKAGLWSFYLNRKALLHQIGVDTTKGVCLGFYDGSSLLFESETENRSGWYQVKFPSYPVTVKRDDLFSYQIIEDKCYLQFNAMYDLQSYLQLCQITGAKVEDNYLNFLPSFLEFIDKMDADIRQHHIQKLVVDMRYNGGGNSMLGDQLLQYLGVDTDSISKYKTFVRKSDFLFKCMPDFYDCSKGKPGELIPMGDCEHLPFLPKIKNRFEGKVIFIQGQNTFSSANYLLTTIKDNHLFPIIGTPTSQKPTCFGDVLPVELPFTGTKGYISHSYFERPDVLWKVSGNGLDRPSYVIGTHHLASLSVKDSIAHLQQAIDQTEQVYGEIVMDDANNPEILMKMQQAMMLPADTTLKSFYTQAQYDTIAAVVKNYMGVDLALFDKLKPATITTQLSVALAMKSLKGFNPQEQLDTWFQKQARQAGKKVGSLETIDMQINVLYNSQTLMRQALLLYCTATHIEQSVDQSLRMNQAYMKQDLDELLAIIEEKTSDACDSTPEEISTLIYGRNANWARQFPSIMKQSPTLFVVGAGHLPGPQGLLKLLQKQGYTVEAMN